MKFKVEELKTLFPVKISSKNTVSISTDSRTITPGQIFLPLTGQNFNAHDFINSVLEKSESIYSFCEKRKLHKVNERHKNRLILVENTLDSYHKLANFYRKKINPKVIAITGSSGKTTVKDLISAVLSVRYKTHKTEANHNNEFGVPKTILDMPNDTQVLVLELAMRARGEIKYLAKTAEPDIVVITSIGTAHIGILGNIEEIIKAKCEVLEHLKSNGFAILPNNPSLIEYSKNVWKGKSFIFDSTIESTQILNYTIASKAASELGMSQAEIQSGLSSFKVPSGRGNVVNLGKDKFLIDETYNANPDSVKTAVSNLIDLWNKEYKKILVLGELAELGEYEDKLLTNLASWLKGKPLDAIITVGGKLKQLTSATNVENIDKCCAILDKLLVPGSVVLVKGSHVAGLESVVKHLNKDKE